MGRMDLSPVVCEIWALEGRLICEYNLTKLAALGAYKTFSRSKKAILNMDTACNNCIITVFYSSSGMGTSCVKFHLCKLWNTMWNKMEQYQSSLKYPTFPTSCSKLKFSNSTAETSSKMCFNTCRVKVIFSLTFTSLMKLADLIRANHHSNSLSLENQIDTSDQPDH